jgi:hypothetical protein
LRIVNLPAFQIVNTYNNWNWGVGFVDTTPNNADSKVYSLRTTDNIFGLILRINRPANGSLMVTLPVYILLIM